MKGHKKNKAAKLAAASLLIGSLGIGNVEASQLISFKGLGSGAELRYTLARNFDSGTNASTSFFAADTLSNHEKGGEGKCGEGKCGDGKKSPTPTTDKDGGEGKCGEGKCGE